MAATPPPEVAADPAAPHAVSRWSVPLRDGVRDFTVTGRLDWVPRPAPAVWWASALLLCGLLAFVGAWRLAVAGWVGIGTGVAALAYAVGTALDSGALGTTGVLRTLVGTQPWALLCGTASVAAGLYALRRKPAADLALGLAGATVALFAGAANAGVFAHAIAPVPFEGVAARTLVLLCIAGGAGLAAVTGLRMRRQPRPAGVG